MEKNIICLIGICLLSTAASAQSKAVFKKGAVGYSFASTVMIQASDSQPSTPDKMDFLFEKGGVVDGDPFIEDLSVLYGLGAARKWQPTEVVSAIASMQQSMSKTVPNLFLTALTSETVTLVIASWQFGTWNYVCVDPLRKKLFRTGFRLYYIKTV